MKQTGGPIGCSWPVVAVVAVLLYLVRGVLLPFIVGAVLAYVCLPAVRWLAVRLRLPRWGAVVLFYLLVVGPLLAAAVWFAPALARETAALLAGAPAILASLLTQLLGDGEISLLGQNLQATALAGYLLDSLRESLGTPQEAIHLASLAIDVVFNAFLSLVLLFYLLLDGERFASLGLSLVPLEHRPRARATLEEVGVVLGRYLRGVIFLIAFMAVMTWLGLFLLFRLPYAIPIAVATGFLEIIPFVGPITAGAIAGLVALNHGGAGLLVAVVVFYVVLRQLEDQIVSPYVLGRAIALHPVGIIFAVLAGGALAGLLGVVLAIPVAAAAKVFLSHWLDTSGES